MKKENSYSVCRRKKKHSRFRLCIRFAVVFLFISAAGAGTGSRIFYAASGMQKNARSSAHKYYTSIQIAEGSTLRTIAEEYISEEYSDTGSYIYEVMQINALNEEKIHAGQFLIVPYYSEEKK